MTFSYGYNSSVRQIYKYTHYRKPTEQHTYSKETIIRTAETELSTFKTMLHFVTTIHR